MDCSVSKPILEQISKYRRRASEFRQQAQTFENFAAEQEKLATAWDAILSQVQVLQRGEQPEGQVIEFVPPQAKRPARRSANRFEFAREVMRQHRSDGVLPVDIRKLANDSGISCPTNYPYKLLTRMVNAGKARKDEATGRYFI